MISTGQHTDLVDDLIRRVGMRVDANLHASEPVDGVRPTLNAMFARVMVGIDRVWSSETVPAEYVADGRRGVDGAVACLVHGDTSCAAAAALASFNLQIPVVHVEAGLRTSNLLSPFPEEGNRQLISRIAALHLAPTTDNKMNLVREGVDYDRIVVTGNTSIDMLHWAAGQEGGFGAGLEGLEVDAAHQLVLVTAHRRENWGEGLVRIAAAVRTLSEQHADARFVVPMHPNPVARQPMLDALADRDNVFLVEPREYADFARLMAAARLIITDSGGVQEEARVPRDGDLPPADHGVHRRARVRVLRPARCHRRAAGAQGQWAVGLRRQHRARASVSCVLVAHLPGRVPCTAPPAHRREGLGQDETRGHRARGHRGGRRLIRGQSASNSAISTSFCA
ncbi:non-hydrolyzing UDP-N-acetylglucosamine 2-epimerase [Microbacterium sp.]|uniref:non-hydrolyzing UDP-N-acetylglucosamine 2-epimerase n=1 Tax=Microbacterium sp. TaxID=51671 RepID=UPI003A918679